MTLIPLALSIWAVIRLQGTDNSELLWTIVGVTIVAWLTNQAVRNNAKMEGKYSNVTAFWVKASMVMFIANCGVAIAGLVVDKGADSTQASQDGQQPNDSGRVALAGTANLTQEQRTSVDSFFSGYEYLKSLNRLAKAQKSPPNAVSDVKHIRSLVARSLDRFSNCNPRRLNEVYGGWGNITSNKLLPGLRKLQSGMSVGGSRLDLDRADAMLGDFDTWLYSNWNRIGSRIGTLSPS